MKKLIYFVLAMGLIFSLAEARVEVIQEDEGWFPLQLFSIIRDYTAPQSYFDQCNPCTFHIEIQNERKFFDEVKFNVVVSGGVSSYVNDCITITQSDIDYGDSSWAKSMWCQNHGYRDYGYSSENKDWNSCGGVSYDCLRYHGDFCIRDSIRCWKSVSITPKIVTIKQGETKVWDMVASKQITPTQNLAYVLNSYCKDNIEACHNYYNRNLDVYKYKCLYDTCEVPFVVTSDVNGGGYRVDPAPLTFSYLPEGVNPFGTNQDAEDSTDLIETPQLPADTTTQQETFNLMVWFKGVLDNINTGVCNILPNFIC